MNTVHRDYLELAATALDFKLSAAERARLDAHLAGCDVCRRRVAALRSDDVEIAALPSFRLAPESVDRLRPLFRPSPRLDVSVLRLILVATLLATVLLASLATGAELLRREVERRLSVVPPAPVTLPTPSASGEPSPVAFGDWRSTGPLGALANGQVDGVFPSVDGVRMTGCVEAPAGRCADPAVWRSADGLQWSNPDLLPLDPDEEPNRVSAATFSGLMFIGGSVRHEGGYRAAIWSSEDGRTWTRADHDPTFEGATITTFVETAAGWVALGSGLFEDGEMRGLKAWSSADGLNWTPSPQAESDETGFPGWTVQLLDDSFLAWGPIASGTRWWASATGETWDVIPDPPGLEGAAISSIEFDDGEPTAVGQDNVDGALPGSQYSWWTQRAGSGQWVQMDSDDGAGLPLADLTIVSNRIDMAVAVTGDKEARAVWYRPRAGEWRPVSTVPAGLPVGLAQLTESNTFVLVLRDDLGVVRVAVGDLP